MITLKRATIEDAEDYAHILNKSWKDTYGEYILIEHIDKEFNIENLILTFPSIITNKDQELYIIQYDNAPIGIVLLGKPDRDDAYKEQMNDFGEILSLHILKDFRHQGFGTAVIKFAEDRLLELGYKHSFVWVKKQNLSAIKFYTKNGYNVTNYSCDNPPDKAPSFVMEKYNIKGV